MASTDMQEKIKYLLYLHTAGRDMLVPVEVLKILDALILKLPVFVSTKKSITCSDVPK